ncbi:ATP-binding protein [Luteolibacter flavescens]|uniref:histidine kinase n=1 Tax=Luteolibacter flavescens TaxID=1859460 RepID=A0ABT3FRI1_9BACT|nr:PAS domain-containing hybrid sensor histidine kinase/response regulator [Luteolibacter flavescens]MCW1886198.1 ATP-binding protein [Luteolibacter flavescens]
MSANGLNAASPAADAPPNHQWVNRAEMETLRQKLREVQETLDAIQSGDVDAVVVSGDHGSQIYTLSGAEEPYRIYVEQMREGAVTATEGGMVLYCNKRFADFVGLPLERVISAGVADFLRPGVWEEIVRGLADSDFVKTETEIAHGAGVLPVLITGSRVATTEDPVLCLVVTDLSAQKEKERLTLANEVAEAANRAKDSFLAVLSHELRTPLTPALMGTYLLEEDATLGPQAKELVKMIRKNVEVETRLIDDLLDLTRVTEGKIQLRKELVDLHHVVAEAVKVCAPGLVEQSQTITQDLQATSSQIHGDPVRIQQILWNLIRNASKFSRPGTAIAIRSWNDANGNVQVSVQDQGIGIEPQIMAKLFKPFEQGGEDMTRKFGGLGLGLVISKSLAELHEGGRIEAHSPGKDQGSTFTLRFRTSSATPREEVTSRTEMPAKARVLVVEDNRDARMAVVLWLRTLEYEVTEADCVATALQLAGTREFDILISDIGLPDATGYELMSGLRGKGIIGIAMSGYGQHDDVEKSKEAGFSDHLIKPVAPKTLESALAAALKRSKAGAGVVG